ncbi:zf-HC2 domain-containing protein [Streptomyces sp. ME01-24h]|nr:zf-HC2 domain-containing protein [Streptomyces sp. ME19-03-3]MDX3215706.1 zf-HC2 domain-containing protein [Streptomyces sp. ME02-6991-2B]MDX3351913.1 zf-HC2 domain-containing protein [Streptomyces sp. ME01-24h]MDX3351940.1 zf-HC2 domain-containing protein [Streptomyces sp. ME01-24h]
MSTQHQPGELIGAYVLGILGPAERQGVEEHILECEACREEVKELREMEAALDSVPPEAFLEGPVEDGDLLLQRTLRQARTEEASARRRRSWAVGAGAAASAAVLFLAGYLVAGNGSASGTEAGGAPAATATPAPPVPPAGVQVASGTDPGTGARMTVRMTPAVGWARFNASVTGIPAGEHCRLVVVSQDGDRQIAGGWVVAPASEGSAGKGANLDGSAAIPADSVKSVVVENTSGKTYVTVPL